MDGIPTGISATSTAKTWLSDFEAALNSGDAARIAALFAHECHWRDILAFTWNLRTASGAAAIAERLLPALSRMAPRELRLAAGRTPPRRVKRAGTEAIEAIFAFETDGRSLQRRRAPGLRRRRAAARLDAHDRARRDPRTRGPGQRPALAGRGLEAQFRRRELARPAQQGARLRRPRPRCAGGGRRAGRALDRGAADACSAWTRSWWTASRGSAIAGAAATTR